MKTMLRWLVVRQGDDRHWWVDETSEERVRGSQSLGVLDPSQVAHLRKTLLEYEPYGLDRSLLARAFHLFEVSSPMPDGRLKLVPSLHGFADEGVPLFALPDLDTDEEGGYSDLLDQIAALRIQRLNATHHYFQELTELDMDEDLRALDTDRYFAGRPLHIFDEMEEILTWKPAEWDDPDPTDESAGPAVPPENERHDD